MKVRRQHNQQQTTHLARKRLRLLTTLAIFISTALISITVSACMPFTETIITDPIKSDTATSSDQTGSPTDTTSIPNGTTGTANGSVSSSTTKHTSSPTTKPTTKPNTPPTKKPAPTPKISPKPTKAPTQPQQPQPTQPPQQATPAPTPTPAVSPDGRSGAQLDTPFSAGGIIIVSKNHWVNANYRPLPDSQQNVSLAEPAWSSFQEMRNQLAAEGIGLDIRSTYRTYEYQADLFALRVSQWGEATASRSTARPGQSEHQTGLAVDVMSGGVSGTNFAYTPAGIWLRENSWKYGFILRYPEGKEYITGYVYEPWHYRYIGEAAANFGPNSSLTLEEYLGIN